MSSDVHVYNLYGDKAACNFRMEDLRWLVGSTFAADGAARRILSS